MHDNTLTADNRDKFVYLAGRYNQLVKFYNVAELCADKLEAIRKLFPKANKTRFTTAMFYRFFIPDVLSAEIDKAIYFDADIIVNLDINELWQINLEDKVMAVVPEKSLGLATHTKTLCIDGYVKIEDYFNSGVLSMNLNLLRGEEENLMNGIKFINENPQYGTWLDQNILNYCFSSRTVKLPVKFNTLLKNWAGITPIQNNAIYHYAGKRFGLNTDKPFQRLWMSYFMRTPFFDVDTMGRFYSELMRIRSFWKDRTVELSSIVSGKIRAFFVEPEKIESMKKLLSMNNNELLILAKNEDSLKTLVDVMKAYKGKCVFFIMTANFLKKKFPFDMLTKAGFVENKDFVKGWTLLNEEKIGTAYNSAPIINAI